MSMADHFDKLMTVYVESDDYAAAVRTNEPCALFDRGSGDASTGVERAELLNQRILCWGAAYDLPESSQVVIDAARYQTQRGTFNLFYARIDGHPEYRRCLAVKVR